MTTPANPPRKSAIATISYIAVGSVVSGLGGLVKLPSPVGSVALDSAPGFFAAIYFNPWVGGAVGAIGHLLSAASAGFPAGALHVLIAAGMFVCCWTFGMISRTLNRVWGLWLAALVAIVINNLIPFASVVFGFTKLEAAVALVIPFLLVAAALNVVLACLVYLAIRKVQAPGL